MALQYKLNSGDSYTDLPTPKEVTYSHEKLWSENTGRLDNGYFVGELIGIKHKYEVTFPPLSTTDLTAVKNAVNNQFAYIKIQNAEGGNDEISAYFGSLTCEAYSWHNGIQYAINARVSIIER